MIKLFTFSILVSFLSLSLISCEKQPTKRHYTEISIKPPQKTPLNNVEFSAPSSKPKINWQLPHHWKEESPKGMRLFSISISHENLKGDLSITSLSGIAGGLEANITRWLGQINLASLDAQSLNLFIKKEAAQTTKNNMPILILDFNHLLENENGDHPSILAGIIERNKQTYFIKLTGPKGLLEIEKNNFISFVTSLELAS